MSYRFDGRVAVVTGAGRGIGRAYALLLAERGARVVVNDLGGSIKGIGEDTGPASAVVDEIGAAGGSAFADSNDVATTAGGQALVDAALEQFGRVDILINNAGIMRWATFPDVSDAIKLRKCLTESPNFFQVRDKKIPLIGARKSRHLNMRVKCYFIKLLEVFNSGLAYSPVEDRASILLSRLQTTTQNHD